MVGKGNQVYEDQQYLRNWRTPSSTNICAAFDMQSTCINFLSRSNRLNFLMTMDYSPWSGKGNLAVFEGSNIYTETGEATSTKIGVHAFDIKSLLA